MSQLKVLFILICMPCLTSCVISKYVAPPFTDLDKILELRPGQTTKEVTETLKIKPYDVIYSHDKGKMLLIYNYRVKDRRMVLPMKTAGQVIFTEKAQREGDVWYNKNYRELYVLFQENKVKGIYGEDVLAIGAQIETMDSHLNGQTTLANEDLLFAQSIYQERYNRKSAELSEDQEAKNRRKMLIGGVTIVTGLILGLIL